MARLFIAIDVPADIRLALAEAVRSFGAAGFRWSKPENYHLTLAFLGDADPELVVPALAASTPTGVPLDIEVVGWGAFPKAAGARVFWAGVQGGEALIDLAGRVRSACRSVAPEMDMKVYSPHLTLGRAQAPVDVRQLNVEMPSMQWSVDRYGLIESRLSPRGAGYTTLGEFPI